MARPSISVVIPALDEATSVGRAIASVRDADEVLVVDGGSRDATRERASGAGARVIEGPTGRGRQLAQGAAAASGDWLVFLHADTRLEAGWAASLRALPERYCGGAFRFAFDGGRRALRVVEWGVHARCALFALPYGDQALFARRAAYDAAGGFAPLPRMEDVDFVLRLRRVGPLAFPPLRAFTSARRWEAQGIVATTLTHAWCLGRYALGADPARLTRPPLPPDGGLGAEELRWRRSPHGTGDGLRPASEPDRGLGAEPPPFGGVSPHRTGDGLRPATEPDEPSSP